MRRAAGALAVALLVAAPGWARAEDDAGLRPVALTDAMAGAFELGRNGDAYAMSLQLIELVPDDADARYLAAIAAINVVRDDEARAHVEAGLAVHPDDVDLLGLRAQLRVAAGDEAGARADAERAIALDRGAADAAVALHGLDVLDRARRRLAGEDPDLTAGSAARFVDELCARIAAGDVDGIAASFDLAILDSLPAERRTAATLRALLRWLRDDRGRRFLGWWVEPTWEERGSLAWVTVRAPFEEDAPEARVARYRRALADPAGPAALDDETRAVLEGVPDADREALLARMAGVHTRGVMDLRFAVRRRGDRHQVTDVQVDGVAAREHLATWLRLSDATAVAETPRARQGSSGIAVLLLLAIVPAVVLAAAIFGARNRRRRRHHAALSARRGSG